MATKRKPAKSGLTNIDRRLIIAETKLADHDKDLTNVADSVEQLKTTINRWSGALLIVTPIVAFLGTLLGQRLF